MLNTVFRLVRTGTNSNRNAPFVLFFIIVVNEMLKLRDDSKKKLKIRCKPVLYSWSTYNHPTYFCVFLE